MIDFLYESKAAVTVYSEPKSVAPSIADVKSASVFIAESTPFCANTPEASIVRDSVEATAVACAFSEFSTGAKTQEDFCLIVDPVAAVVTA
jgi:hypothetical protein